MDYTGCFPYYCSLLQNNYNVGGKFLNGVHEKYYCIERRKEEEKDRRKDTILDIPRAHSQVTNGSFFQSKDYQRFLFTCFLP